MVAFWVPRLFCLRLPSLGLGTPPRAELPSNQHGSARRPTNQEETVVFLQGSVHKPMLAGGRVRDSQVIPSR